MKIHNVEQRTPEWYELRSGIPTASSFDSLVTPTGKPSTAIMGYACQLAAEKMAGSGVNAWGGNMDVTRGRLLEDDALALYAFETGSDVQTVGFITDDAERYGCSPDALVGDGGMVEVKCLNAANHIEAMFNHIKSGEEVKKHKPQTQGQLWIAEREWCDLVLYHANLPIHTIRVYRDEEYIDMLAQAVSNVIKTRDEITDTIGGRGTSDKAED